MFTCGSRDLREQTAQHFTNIYVFFLNKNLLYLCTNVHLDKRLVNCEHHSAEISRVRQLYEMYIVKTTKVFLP